MNQKGVHAVHKACARLAASWINEGLALMTEVGKNLPMRPAMLAVLSA